MAFQDGASIAIVDVWWTAEGEAFGPKAASSYNTRVELNRTWYSRIDYGVIELNEVSYDVGFRVQGFGFFRGLGFRGFSV